MRINNRPEITEEIIREIRELIANNPKMGRTKISALLCEMWGWSSPTGQLKDMSCRDMLRALDKAGKIKLPEPLSGRRKTGLKPTINHFAHDETSIAGSLKELRPLSVKIASTKKELDMFKSYIDQYHYLGFDRFIGERMAYMVYSRDGTLVSCLLFGSAAWSCKDRDDFIGWGKDHRKNRLNMLTNNTRFLILPWVRVPHLASHTLSLISKRVSNDWEMKYGHPVHLLETFVERRFKGTCYRAANWIHVGCTTGRGRNGGHRNSILPIKEIFLYPLSPDFQAILSQDETIIY